MWWGSLPICLLFSVFKLILVVQLQKTLCSDSEHFANWMSCHHVFFSKNKINVLYLVIIIVTQSQTSPAIFPGPVPPGSLRKLCTASLGAPALSGRGGMTAPCELCPYYLTDLMFPITFKWRLDIVPKKMGSWSQHLLKSIVNPKHCMYSVHKNISLSLFVSIKASTL